MAAWTHLAHDSLSLPAKTVTWSSIPGSYDHLVVKVSSRSDNASYLAHSLMRFNGDTTNAYGRTSLVATTTTPTSTTTYLHADAGVWAQIPGSSADASCFGSQEYWIPNYSNSVGFKSVLVSAVVENASNTDNQWSVALEGHLWHDTDAITQIDLLSYYDDYVAHSTFDLYGITGA